MPDLHPALWVCHLRPQDGLEGLDFVGVLHANLPQTLTSPPPPEIVVRSFAARPWPGASIMPKSKEKKSPAKPVAAKKAEKPVEKAAEKHAKPEKANPAAAGYRRQGRHQTRQTNPTSRQADKGLEARKARQVGKIWFWWRIL
jgi:hypothetical protein